MFWDQETKGYLDYDFEFDKVPSYRVLETVFERVYKKTWYKLDVNRRLWHIITTSKGQNENWELVKENNGAKFLWVTDKMLTLILLQGAVETK